MALRLRHQRHRWPLGAAILVASMLTNAYAATKIQYVPMFRAMLQYKCLWAGAAFEVVSERLSTQTCSDCASVRGP